VAKFYFSSSDGETHLSFLATKILIQIFIKYDENRICWFEKNLYILCLYVM